MAIYKTVSSKEIIRKVMRDLNPGEAEWIHDAIEWIGEALEHIGASAQLETKVCTLDISSHKTSLPPDLYYINQIGVHKTLGVEARVSEITDLKRKVQALTSTYQSTQTSMASEVINHVDGTYVSNLTEDDLKTYSNLKKSTDHEIREINSRLSVLDQSFAGDSMSNISPLKYCTSSFPSGLHCESCINETANSAECYLVENGYVKTSFPSGTICISYKAFPTDADCYPLVPDDISFREAMFWYIYKKMLLGGYDSSKNRIGYEFAEQQWKYYCTQARNSAVFPDIDRMQSFMNQWVRLVPEVNAHSFTFDGLGDRTIVGI
jgi:hypothetical protein